MSLPEDPSTNANVAELLAIAAEEMVSPLDRTCRSASRKALLWTKEASDLFQDGRSLTELPGVSVPTLKKIIRRWVETGGSRAGRDKETFFHQDAAVLAAGIPLSSIPQQSFKVGHAYKTQALGNEGLVWFRCLFESSFSLQLIPYKVTHQSGIHFTFAIPSCI